MTRSVSDKNANCMIKLKFLHLMAYNDETHKSNQQWTVVINLKFPG
jgi:hypothetical protein